MSQVCYCRFNGFPNEITRKPLKRFLDPGEPYTWLKPGENERTCEAKLRLVGDAPLRETSSSR